MRSLAKQNKIFKSKSRNNRWLPVTAKQLGFGVPIFSKIETYTVRQDPHKWVNLTLWTTLEMLLIIREVLANPKEECAQKGSVGNSNG